MRFFRFIFLIVLVFLGVVFLFTLKKDSRTQKIFLAGKPLRVEIRKTSAGREKGLSDREILCSDCGMLFIFDQTGIYTFWMKRMRFDIDILWIAGDRVVDITYGAKAPSGEDFEAPKERYSSKAPINKVLEVNAGWVKKNGIVVGDRMSVDY